MYSMQGMVWYGMAWHGMVWHGMAWHGMVWHCNDMAWHGMITNTACYNYGIVQKKFDIVEYMAWVSLLSYPSKWNNIYGTVGLLLTRISLSSRGGKSFSGRNLTCQKQYTVLSLSLSLSLSLFIAGLFVTPFSFSLSLSLYYIFIIEKLDWVHYTNNLAPFSKCMYCMHYSNGSIDPATHMIMIMSVQWRSFFYNSSIIVCCCCCCCCHLHLRESYHHHHSNSLEDTQHIQIIPVRYTMLLLLLLLSSLDYRHHWYCYLTNFS